MRPLFHVAALMLVMMGSALAQPLEGAIQAPQDLTALSQAAKKMGSASGGVQVGEIPAQTDYFGQKQQILVDRYEDPEVRNVFFYVIRPESENIKTRPEAINSHDMWMMDHQASLLSLDCRATGPVSIPDNLPNNEIVFKDPSSPLAKTFKITRIVDRQTSTLVYVILDDSRRFFERYPREGLHTIQATPAHQD